MRTKTTAAKSKKKNLAGNVSYKAFQNKNVVTLADQEPQEIGAYESERLLTGLLSGDASGDEQR